MVAVLRSTKLMQGDWPSPARSVTVASYNLAMLVRNREGILAAILPTLARRGAKIKSLDFKPSSRSGLAIFEAHITLDDVGVADVLKDFRGMAEVKTASIRGA